MNDGTTLDARTLLTTTRSVRRNLDRTRPVPVDTVLDCLDVARQAPNGGDDEAWRWIVVTDPARREAIGELYQRSNAGFAATLRARAAAGDEAARRKVASSEIFWDHLATVPVLVAACFEQQSWFDPTSEYALASGYGSVFPAVWNFQLALRLEGLASCLVTSHLRYPEEMAQVLELPPTFRQVALVAVGHFITDAVKPGRRGPRERVVRLDHWS